MTPIVGPVYPIKVNVIEVPMGPDLLGVIKAVHDKRCELSYEVFILDC